jgi:hypothetical protein
MSEFFFGEFELPRQRFDDIVDRVNLAVSVGTKERQHQSLEIGDGYKISVSGRVGG